MCKLILVAAVLFAATCVSGVEGQGTWRLLVQNAGVSAMHMATNRFNKVIMFDRTDYGPSQIALPNGKCRHDPKDLALTTDCSAHSIELHIYTNKIRPLQLLTDTWCSSGAFAANGTLLHTGGFNDGGQAIRYFPPCNDNSCDWIESGQLLAYRWYATDQVLPDNSIFVVGGKGSLNYEILPHPPGQTNAVYFGFLQDTFVTNINNNLYPFVHLSSDGNLFIFANYKSVLLNYKTNIIVRTFPDLPGGGRSYPSTGSSVMLPLHSSDNFHTVEVMICGGAPDGSAQLAFSGKFIDALKDCARIVITDPNPRWAVENMPTPRVMSDMLILPTGEVLIINGAQQGVAGWGDARIPSLSPFLYKPTATAGKRFSVLAASTIPRMYHSTANVLPDGRILVAGSNSNYGYVFSGVLYPTELRIEAYSPYYLDAANDYKRPTITAVSANYAGYGKDFTVTFKIGSAPGNLQFAIYAPPFNTHSYSMNQRLLFLGARGANLKVSPYSSIVTAPPSPIAAPAGYYMLFVVNNGIPSTAAWVQFGW